MIWQCTVAEELSCHRDLESISLPFSCPFESKKLRYRRGGEGGLGFLIQIGQGSSIWKFWSGEPLWMVLRSKPSDVAVWWAADENKETGFDIVCPSVCPQTNRMKAWPLILPRLLPFSLRLAAKQPGPSEKLCPDSHLCARERVRIAVQHRVNLTTAVADLISCLPRLMRKHTMLQRIQKTVLSRSLCLSEEKYSGWFTFASNADAVYSGFLKDKENTDIRGEGVALHFAYKWCDEGKEDNVKTLSSGTLRYLYEAENMTTAGKNIEPFLKIHFMRMANYVQNDSA